MSNKKWPDDPEQRAERLRKMQEGRERAKAKREAEAKAAPDPKEEPKFASVEEENKVLRAELNRAMELLDAMAKKVATPAEEAPAEPKPAGIAPTSRANESRASEMRTNQTRKKAARYTPPEVLDCPDAPHGMTYRWIAEYVRGEYQDGNLSFRHREGWVPVKRDELPDGYHVANSGDGLVRTGGLLLMKLPTEMVEQRRAYYLGRSQDALRGANELQGIATKGVALPVSVEDDTRSLEGTEAMNFLQEASAEG